MYWSLASRVVTSAAANERFACSNCLVRCRQILRQETLLLIHGKQSLRRKGWGEEQRECPWRNLLDMRSRGRPRLACKAELTRPRREGESARSRGPFRCPRRYERHRCEKCIEQLRGKSADDRRRKDGLDTPIRQRSSQPCGECRSGSSERLARCKDRPLHVWSIGSHRASTPLRRSSPQAGRRQRRRRASEAARSRARSCYSDERGRARRPPRSRRALLPPMAIERRIPSGRARTTVAARPDDQSPEVSRDTQGPRWRKPQEKSLSNLSIAFLTRKGYKQVAVSPSNRELPCASQLLGCVARRDRRRYAELGRSRRILRFSAVQWHPSLGGFSTGCGKCG